MVKSEYKKIIENGIVGGFFSALFTCVFNILTKSFNPIIILYTIISALGVLILFNGIEKILIVIYGKVEFWLEINRYNKKVNQVVELFKKIMLTKEIIIVDLIELEKYLDPKIQFYKPSRASIDFFSANAIKKSTLDVISKMIIDGILIYIESKRLILLKEKMTCIKCGGEILFQDKLDFVDVKCSACSEKYSINYDGLWHVDKQKDHLTHNLHIRIKHLNRLRV